MDFPYDYNLVNNGFVQAPNLWLKHLNYQDCVLTDELEINQTPPLTLKSFDTDDDNKREGFPGGWFADWTTSDLSYSGYHDANREFVEILFPCMLKVTAFRIQGIKKIEVGNETTEDLTTDPVQPVGHIEISSLPKKVEFSCSDGNDWYSIENGSNPPKWVKLEDLMANIEQDNHINETQYDNI
jgi:hypothetical protein